MNTKICVKKFLDKCKDCVYDMDIDHHPNNMDCPGFEPMTLFSFEVIEKKPKKRK